MQQRILKYSRRRPLTDKLFKVVFPILEIIVGHPYCDLKLFPVEARKINLHLLPVLCHTKSPPTLRNHFYRLLSSNREARCVEAFRERSAVFSERAALRAPLTRSRVPNFTSPLILNAQAADPVACARSLSPGCPRAQRASFP